jgi:hypothetical protein
MPHFPQLKTGATHQFPCTKRIIQRTIVNEPASGAAVKLFDPGACRAEWQLELSGLTIEEWAAIDDLFGSVEGQLGTFGFLDPFGNLLKWSEDLSAAAWSKDAGLQLTGGTADPTGGTQAARISNGASSEQNVGQSVPVPGAFQYCLSVYARGDAAGSVRLFASSGGQTASETFPLGSAWRRIELSTALTSQDQTVVFGAAIPGGATVELFGFQAEGQIGASAYKRTTTHCGAIANASFLDDELRLTTNAPGEFSCTVRIGASAS